MKRRFKFDLGIIGMSIWLTIILAVLKITNILNIPILWVFFPMILSFGLTTILMCILFTLMINNIKAIEEEEAEEDEENNDDFLEE